MKYAIVSDIHANLEALTSVLDDVSAHDVDRLICLGDVVGYNANPCECIDILRDTGCLVLRGNHDAYAVSGEIPAVVNNRARLSLEWTREQLSSDHWQWLSNLPMHRRIGGFEVVHASLHQPEDWNYVTNAIEAILHFHFQQTGLCFFGHIHSQLYFTTEKRKTYKDFGTLRLDREQQYLVNVGSVGQPRSDDKRAEYVIYDTRTNQIETRKVEYDIEQACDKIRRAGLPEHNALRLKKTDKEVMAALKQSQEKTSEPQAKAG
ncbi:MAG: metallophosphoesterase family protein [Akkermansiaceae bacterium]